MNAKTAKKQSRKSSRKTRRARRSVTATVALRRITALLSSMDRTITRARRLAAACAKGVKVGDHAVKAIARLRA